MDTPPGSDVEAPLVKVITAWAAVILSDYLSAVWLSFKEAPWDKFAQFAAFIYSVCLIYEYIRKKRNNGTKQNLP